MEFSKSSQSKLELATIYLIFAYNFHNMRSSNNVLLFFCKLLYEFVTHKNHTMDSCFHRRRRISLRFKVHNTLKIFNSLYIVQKL
jgi:hypothetical protein